MKMKVIRTILSSATIATAAVSGVAYAADGRVDISGQINASTCTINGQGGGNVAQTVTLPPVTEAALTSAGSYAATTGVSFAIAGCDTSLTLAKAHFEPVTGVFTNNGNIANTGGAGNVEIQLLDKNYTPLNLASDTADAALNSGNGTLQMYARYYSPNGNASAGTVAGSAQFTLVYQ